MTKRFRRIVGLTLIISMSALSKNYIKAETVDDLRELLGYHRANSIATISEVARILENKRDSDEAKEIASRVSTIEKRLKAESEEKLDKLINEKASKEDLLLSLLSTDEHVYKIMPVLRELDGIVYDIQKSNIGNINIIINTDTYENIEEEYEYAKMMLESIENDIELGDIGRGLKPPTSGIFKLSDAFGTYLDADTSTQEVQNKGVGLLALKYENTLVLCQWHGKVKSIKDGKITIQHGPSLVTVYNKIKDIKVKTGDTVKQYDELGNVDGESLYFSIKLDGKYIDPMMVYGVEGVEAYFNWVQANPSRIITVNDMSNIKNKIEDTKDKIDNTPTEGTEGLDMDENTIKATLPDDYEAPNPGVLQ